MPSCDRRTSWRYKKLMKHDWMPYDMDDATIRQIMEPKTQCQYNKHDALRQCTLKMYYNDRKFLTGGRRKIFGGSHGHMVAAATDMQTMNLSTHPKLQEPLQKQRKRNQFFAAPTYPCDFSANMGALSLPHTHRNLAFTSTGRQA